MPPKEFRVVEIEKGCWSVHWTRKWSGGFSLGSNVGMYFKTREQAEKRMEWEKKNGKR